MKRNRFIMLLIIIAAAFIMPSCTQSSEEGNTTPQNQNKEAEWPFEVLHHDRRHNYKVIYHKETKVMYTESWGGDSYGQLTLMVNPDGTPLLYKGK